MSQVDRGVPVPTSVDGAWPSRPKTFRRTDPITILCPALPDPFMADSSNPRRATAKLGALTAAGSFVVIGC